MEEIEKDDRERERALGTPALKRFTARPQSDRLARLEEMNLKSTYTPNDGPYIKIVLR